MNACTCPDTRLSDLPAATSGDREALARLVSVHRAQMRGAIARRIPGDLRGLVDADDVIQETYLAALASIRGFRPAGQGSFCRWLHTIARRRLADLVKSQRRGKRKRGVAVEIEAASDGDGPAMLVDRDDHLRLLCDALIHLPQRQREALRLHYLEGSPIADVAAQLGASGGAVAMLCSRALVKLRSALTP